MTRMYETKREMVDDLLLLYGEIAGVASTGKSPSNALLIERVGRIIEKAHNLPSGHQQHVDRARELAKERKPLHRPDLKRGHQSSETVKDDTRKRERVRVVK